MNSWLFHSALLIEIELETGWWDLRATHENAFLIDWLRSWSHITVLRNHSWQSWGTILIAGDQNRVVYGQNKYLCPISDTNRDAWKKDFRGGDPGTEKIKKGFPSDNKRGGTKAPWNVLQENVILRATAGALASWEEMPRALWRCQHRKLERPEL